MNAQKHTFYVTEGGELLTTIATKVYGLVSEWERIFKANEDVVSGPGEELEAGLRLTIPPLPEVGLAKDGVRSKNDLLVRADVAHLEGRKLLQEPVHKLNGVSGETENLLALLGIQSIFDLGMSRLFNGVRELVEGAGTLVSGFVQHNFIPGDLFRGDPKNVDNLGVFLGARLEELDFQRGDDQANRELAERLGAALPAETVRDLALWPPFRAARRILDQTFNPDGVIEEDPEAPSDLLPRTGNFATERVQYTSVIMSDIVTPSEQTRDLESAGPIGLVSGVVEGAGATGPAEGAILTTEQAWYAQGVTLGQLLHSLALGPGESTRIAMVDWTRRTSGKTSSSTSQLDRLSQSSAQARSISEITNAIARESQYGSSGSSYGSSSRSGSSTTSGGASIGFLGMGGSISSSSNSAFARNSGFATSVARSRGDRRLSAYTSQGVSARTRQHATAARSRRATIVQETFESEGEVATTRVITNYNHMHAMSLQYYEVVQAYRVRTQVIDYDRVVFVPMKTVNFSDVNSIERYRSILWKYAAFVEWTPGRAALEEIRDALEMDAEDGEAESESRDTNTWQRLISAWKRPRYDSSLRIGENVEALSGAQAKLADARLARIDYSVEHGQGELEGLEITSRIGTSKLVHRFEGDRRKEGRIEFSNLRLEDIDGIRVLFPGRIDRRNDVRLSLSFAGYDQGGGDSATFHHDVPVELLVLSPRPEPPAMDEGERKELLSSAENQQKLVKPWVQTEVLDALMGLSEEGLLMAVGWWDRGERLNRETVAAARLRRRLEPDAGSAEALDARLELLSDEGHRELLSMAEIHSSGTTGDRAEELARLEEALAQQGVSRERQKELVAIPDLKNLLALYAVTRSAEELRTAMDGLEAQLDGLGFDSSMRKLFQPVDDRMVDGNLSTGDLVVLHGVLSRLAADDELRAAERAPIGRLALSVDSKTTSSLVDDRVREWLLRHLNEHSLYYSQAIWLETDPMDLSRALVDLEYKGERIMHSIDPTPVAVTGNYLGFKWMFASAAEKSAWMEANGYEVSEANAEDTMVPLPTGGVFAEAVLGRFNSAEKLDLSRFWNWQESPIPILPAGINSIDMVRPSQGPGAPSTDSTEAPAVRLERPAAMPDPTGMVAAMSGLTAADIFRDMSGAKQTAALAEAAAQTASAQATRATELSGEGAEHAAEQATKALELGMEHQQKMAELALEAAPMVAAPMTGGASLAATGASKAGALLNAAKKLDAAGGKGSGGERSATLSAFTSLIGRVLGKSKS